ncbi:helix-turn-helix transcriptional regulator [Nocardioides sp. Bht2]|uniref:helix-turn-helix transcriptional regulator n=1 Tax=Nocardioides sp. Bht2 TaxID=3392297 RepID=UPI0039B5A4C9
MSSPTYTSRIARLPQVFEILAAYPDGLAVNELAKRVGVPSAELREDLLAFYAADLGPEWLMGLSRPEVIEFVGPDGVDEDPNDAERVRIVDPRPTEELGVEYIDASELALIYTAAQMELEAAWSQELADAVAVLEETLLGDAAKPFAPASAASGSTTLAELQRARTERRQVRIEYSRSWRHGVAERLVQPYRLVHTRRGWEVDAGVDGGELRTFLLSNIRSCEVVEETFTPPADLAERLAAQRATTTVTVEVPFSARWAADSYAEQVRVIAEHEASVELELDLLPPLERRVGLLLLVAGPQAELKAPAALTGARGELARELSEHHRTH